MALTDTLTRESGIRPTCVQPGGGWCVQLELAWGRLRRRWLRRFRPDYVQRLAARRQGECPDCPHDIIDPRDLKYWRNVCGYHFRSEDDAFQWRERLGFARAGFCELIVFGTLFGALTLAFVVLAAAWHVLFWLPAAGAGFCLFETFFFFRDPERTIPLDADVLVSPADGTITDVGIVDDADFPGGRAFRISIFLSIFNVHVNRLPRSGRVTDVRYFPGAFLDARHPDCARRNEQLWIDLDDAGRLLRVKQISGAIARRIVCWLKPGETVRAGARLGMIKFGSRTEVLLPVESAREVLVKVGDKVQGGSSVLLRL
ncbi:MAG: phosphatidylserine decarboxylase [Gemmataceae bacterium]